MSFMGGTHAELAFYEQRVKEQDATIARLTAELEAMRLEVDRLSKGYHESCFIREDALRAQVAKSERALEEARGVLREVAYSLDTLYSPAFPAVLHGVVRGAFTGTEGKVRTIIAQPAPMWRRGEP